MGRTSASSARTAANSASAISGAATKLTILCAWGKIAISSIQMKNSFVNGIHALFVKGVHATIAIAVHGTPSAKVACHRQNSFQS